MYIELSDPTELVISSNKEQKEAMQVPLPRLQTGKQ